MKLELEKEINKLIELESEYETVSEKCKDEQEVLASYMRYIKQKQRVKRLQKREKGGEK